MRKFLVLVATWFVLCGGVVVAQQILPGFPPGTFSNKAALDPAPGGGSTTTFDPAHTDSNIALSGGNLVATWVPSVGSYLGTRSIASHSTGKYFASFTLTSNGGISASDIAIGLTNSGTNCPYGFDAGLSAAQFGSDGNIYVNSASVVSGLPTYGSNGDVLDEAVDTGGQLLWIRLNGGNWNGSALANPTTGVGGGTIAGITGPYHMAVCAQALGAVVWTANFGASPYTYAAPATYGNM